MKYMKKFESWESPMTKEEMITHLCNCGYEKVELDEKSEEELSKMCKSTPSEVSENKSIRENREQENYMFFSNLETIHRLVDELLNMDEEEVDHILSDGHGWALDHIATSADDVEEVFNFFKSHLKKPSHYNSMNEPVFDEANEAKKNKWIQDAIKRPGALRRKLHKKGEEKISAKEIDSELAALKSKDKDKEKPGLQLSKSDRRKQKQLVLAKTLKGLK